MGAGVKGTVLSELTKIAMQACRYFFEVSDLQAQTLTDATAVSCCALLDLCGHTGTVMDVCGTD